MWKPGAPKPKMESRRTDTSTMSMDLSSNSPPVTPNRDKSQRAANGSKSASEIQADAAALKRKHLSNATMGMRFMQRSKAHAEAAAAVLRQITPQEDGNDNDDEDQDVTMQDTSSTPQQQQRKSPVAGSDPGSASSHQLASPKHPPPPHPATATASDMYGVKADMVGRRSFGGFHKSVEEAYQSSFQAWKTGQARGITSKDNMMNALSDEELLRRYQELVNHRGGGGKEDYRKKQDEKDDYTKTCGNDGRDKSQRQSWPIGNLKQQQQPKRNSNSGQKRKR